MRVLVGCLLVVVVGGCRETHDPTALPVSFPSQPGKQAQDRAIEFVAVVDQPVARAPIVLYLETPMVSVDGPCKRPEAGQSWPEAITHETVTKPTQWWRWRATEGLMAQQAGALHGLLLRDAHEAYARDQLSGVWESDGIATSVSHVPPCSDGEFWQTIVRHDLRGESVRSWLAVFVGGTGERAQRARGETRVVWEHVGAYRSGYRDCCLNEAVRECDCRGEGSR